MPHCSDHHCFVGTAMLKLTNVKTTLLTHCIGRRLKQQPFEKVGQKHLIIFLLIKKLLHVVLPRFFALSKQENFHLQ